MSHPLSFPVGDRTWAVDVPAEKRVPLAPAEAPAPSAGPRELMRAALERPIGLNVPLRQALTPEDRVAVVLDDAIPHRNDLLAELVAHLNTAGVEPAAVTVVVPPSESQPWIDELPDELDDLNVEVHDPTDPRKLAFLGTTTAGRKVYLNRTLVGADFVVTLTGRRFAAWGGYEGAEAALFPTLSDAETLGGVSTAASRKTEAEEVAYQLGTPFFVQVIEGEGDGVAEVVAGIGSASREGAKRQKARWGWTANERADLVIVGAGGSDRLTPAGFAVAVANGWKCLAPDGRLVILTDADDSVVSAVPTWEDTAPVFIGCGWSEERVEGLHATKLGSERELGRLIAAAVRVAVLPDAYKIRVTVAGERGA
jgi:nucleotide-binding universal stress UspA family protein